MKPWKSLVPVKIGTYAATDDAITFDLARAKTLLVGGESGSGKSCLIHHILTSLLREHTQDELRLLIADPKLVEYKDYENLPHLLRPIITDSEAMSESLGWLLSEYERRSELLGKYECRNIAAFNEEVCAGTIPEEKLPNIVLVVDEFEDFAIRDDLNFEAAIVRLSALSRAYGIFLVLATQHADRKVAGLLITDLLKCNFAARIAFRTKTSLGSKIVLELPGAERLREREFLFSLDANSANPTAIKLRTFSLS